MSFGVLSKWTMKRPHPSSMKCNRTILCVAFKNDCINDTFYDMWMLSVTSCMLKMCWIVLASILLNIYIYEYSNIMMCATTPVFFFKKKCKLMSMHLKNLTASNCCTIMVLFSELKNLTLVGSVQTVSQISSRCFLFTILWCKKIYFRILPPCILSEEISNKSRIRIKNVFLWMSEVDLRTVWRRDVSSEQFWTFRDKLFWFWLRMKRKTDFSFQYNLHWCDSTLTLNLDHNKSYSKHLEFDIAPPYGKENFQFS